MGRARSTGLIDDRFWRSQWYLLAALVTLSHTPIGGAACGGTTERGISPRCRSTATSRMSVSSATLPAPFRPGLWAPRKRRPTREWAYYSTKKVNYEGEEVRHTERFLLEQVTLPQGRCSTVIQKAQTWAFYRAWVDLVGALYMMNLIEASDAQHIFKVREQPALTGSFGVHKGEAPAERVSGVPRYRLRFMMDFVLVEKDLVAVKDDMSELSLIRQWASICLLAY